MISDRSSVTNSSVETSVSYPKTVAADSDGNMYAGCCGGEGSIEKYSPEGELLWKKPPGRVRGISFAFSGNLLLTVNSKNIVNVMEYSPDGERVNVWEKDELFNPHGISISNRGNVYAAQTSRWADDNLRNGNSILRFSSSGKLIHEWGETGAAPGELNLPVGIAVRFEKVFVADSYNSRIQVYSTEGDFLYGWGMYGDGDGEFNCPQGIAVSKDGNVYVADTYNNRIQVFTEKGIFIKSFGTEGEGDGELWLPCGVAVNDEYIYVADTMNSRIVILEKEVISDQ